MKNYFVISCVLLCSLLTSCDFLTKKFCGELVEVEQNMVDIVENEYGELVSVKPIPCEYLYIDIHLKRELKDTILLDKVHAELYNEKTTDGWQDIVVYDTHGAYLFTHTFKGKIFKSEIGY